MIESLFIKRILQFNRYGIRHLDLDISSVKIPDIPGRIAENIIDTFPVHQACAQVLADSEFGFARHTQVGFRNDSGLVLGGIKDHIYLVRFGIDQSLYVTSDTEGQVFGDIISYGRIKLYIGQLVRAVRYGRRVNGIHIIRTGARLHVRNGYGQCGAAGGLHIIHSDTQGAADEQLVRKLCPGSQRNGIA